MKAPLQFGRICHLEEQCQGFDQVRSSFLHRAALAGDIKLGTQSRKPVVLPFDYRRQTLLHDSSVQQHSRRIRRNAKMETCAMSSPPLSNRTLPGTSRIVPKSPAQMVKVKPAKSA